MQLTPLDHGIYCLDAEYIQPGVAAIYLLVEGGQVAIIETGTTLSRPLVLEALASMSLSVDDVAYVIPTHIHLDHAGGAGALVEACPSAQLVIHPRGVAHMVDPARLIAGTIAVYGEQRFTQYYGEIIPVHADRVIEAADGFELDFNGRMLHFIDTPGHALHHLCVVDARSEGVFTGDTFGIAYPQLVTEQGPTIFATTTPTQFDPASLLNSIDRILESNPKSAYLTHFGQVAITPRLVEQLKQSVQEQADIASTYLNQPDDREARLKSAILSFLSESVLAYGGTEPSAWYRQQLDSDARLNAQGLNVWLQRRERKASS